MRSSAPLSPLSDKEYITDPDRINGSVALGRGAGKGRYLWNLPTTIAELWPPNPSEFDMAYWTSTARFEPGT